jgi:hypothetical protein
MREEVAVGWRRLHIEELRNMYNSPIIWVIKLRMKWAGNKEHTREMRNAYILVEKP